MVINSLKILLIGVTCLLLASCGGNNRWEANTDEVNIAIKYISWNTIIREKDAAKFYTVMKEDSKELYKYYLGTMIGVNPEMDSLCVNTLDQFVNFPSTIESETEIQKLYSDFTPYENEISGAFKRVKYFFPETKELTVITYNSGFNFGVFPVESEIGIGLEMYLGEKNKVTVALPNEKFPQYLKHNMEPKNLVTDVMRAYSIVNLIPEPEEKNLLSRIIYEGKILLTLDAFLPDRPDYEKIRYKKEQYDWCFAYEKEIWKDIVDHQWLYSSEEKMISQFVQEAPFTATMPQNSPPRIGAWLGWQMVRAYANDNPELSLKEILEEKDAGLILRSYKPKK